jgi:hypothetical protein
MWVRTILESNGSVKLVPSIRMRRQLLLVVVLLAVTAVCPADAVLDDDEEEADDPIPWMMRFGAECHAWQCIHQANVGVP